MEVSAARRRLNALVALLSQNMDGTGKTKTVTPEVVVHLDYDSLLNLAQAEGVTAHGQRIGATELRLLLCQARLIPMMFNSLGQVLDVGRSQRLYNTVQRKIIIARDGGCIVPGCTVPPELVEAHHYEDGGWAGGCPTSVDKAPAPARDTTPMCMPDCSRSSGTRDCPMYCIPSISTHCRFRGATPIGRPPKPAFTVPPGRSPSPAQQASMDRPAAQPGCPCSCARCASGTCTATMWVRRSKASR
ncbi:DUF222 domain-containing protein [Arthrobacter sp. JCM 19049]|uniref:DUF222 domain-containing protein n=1 Tax=Arthrobacter sp. JCM 19049 TaxID=1460643 RepID=UPI0035B55941